MKNKDVYSPHSACSVNNKFSSSDPINKDKSFGIIKKKLQNSLAQLKDRELEILKMRYGLDGYKRYTLKEVGKQFNITAERVRQIQVHAVKKLIRKMSIRDYTDIPLTYE